MQLRPATAVRLQTIPIGTRYSRRRAVIAASACGHIGKEFLEELKSDTADLMQCTIKGTGDHIMAASFLAEFIENDTPWVHIDLSASDHEGGLAHIPTKVTGFGVRYTLSLLLDTKIHETVS